MADLDAHYRRWFPIVRAKCIRLLGNRAEAEEIAQETFLRLWQAGKTSDPPREALAWAHTTSTRLAIDRLRRRQIRRDRTPEPQTATHQVHLRLMFAELARGTEDEQLTAILLHRVDGIPQAQIAESLGCTPRTLRRWITDFETRHAEAS